MFLVKKELNFYKLLRRKSSLQRLINSRFKSGTRYYSRQFRDVDLFLIITVCLFDR